ncbi:PREDICTED: small kinetochore-associated protein-like [Thamnophis sirtalis]|uniref:Small kinetochore-associated protein-like n=1 Tax=Thamnophis sirtalis TaxID=35019 RepID=A0A6I9XSL0_9SAUR|nr:PREDICTED: small kinetochore-associated protein-like [Thamnophis sirtalis]XP_032081163.1 small kinetochore-associated protein-like [Thamnophis elegans]
METDKSKIPVYIPQQSKTTGVLKEVQPCDYSKQHNQNKGMDSQPLKDPVFTFSANNPTSCVALKGPNQRLPKSWKKGALPPPPKKAMPTTIRSPMNRYRRETELKNQNRLLENAKSELSLKVVEMQKDMTDMKNLCDSLQKENEKLKKFQESCLLILETKNWDQVTGEQILEEEETNKKIETEITVLSDKLNADLALFIQTAKEEKENIQNAQTRWKQIEEESTHFLEEQQSFQREMEELCAALNQEVDFLHTSET